MDQPEARYFLSKHAHVCVTGDAMVILDQATGSYLSIDRRGAAGLGGLVLDWPLASNGMPRPRMLQTLLDRRLITQDRLRGKSAASARIALPRYWVREGEPRGCPPITARDVRRFLASVTRAACSRTLLPFSYTVSAARRRGQASAAGEVNLQQLALLVRVFDWLRPIAFRKTDECFLYCLAMREFLSRYGIVPAWVFAVRTQPFAAHCWLQHGDQVLTDIPFNLRRMTPILVL
ncbi:lasso peptide biosynthesis B2 protein [Stenotrophomonas sp. 24(2023)]|uniref:lasso peptide biosynthesis B2 protein n=1 Tax=Stenotrophomonas sp. 24(2023) TaxID=3068324 RepID=UPI0027E0654D|nr:lasso peptide biosynthesis B2 protein [Stenotrophomonas sp. 24(2023)]WMJ69203.1 lasso peptide biosynthesis B2 protein [Stenotrophomonas sp. 24(2023)]